MGASGQLAWASGQAELAACYLIRLQGAEDENLETAIASLEKAADVLDGKQAPRGGAAAAPPPAEAEFKSSGFYPLARRESKAAAAGEDEEAEEKEGRMSGGRQGGSSLLSTALRLELERFVHLTLGVCYLRRSLSHGSASRRMAVDVLQKAVACMPSGSDALRGAQLRLAQAHLSVDEGSGTVGLSAVNQCLGVLGRLARDTEPADPIQPLLCWHVVKLWLHKARIAKRDVEAAK